MEYGNDPGSLSPEKDDKDKPAKAESLKPALDKLFEKQNQHEAAEKIAKSETIWQRLTGRGQGEETAPEVPETNKKPSETEADALEGEIVLSHDEQREIASEYVDLRREAIAGEVSEPTVLPETRADDQLLATAQEQLAAAPASAPYTETIERVYRQTAETIQNQPAVLRHEVTPTEWQSREQAAAQARPETPESTPASPAIRESHPEPAWYGLSDSERWYYPRTWPPRPEKSMIDKVTEERREKSRDQRKKKEIKQQVQREVAAVQSYVDTKEQAIRHLAQEQVMAMPNPEAAPTVRTTPGRRLEAPRPPAAERAGRANPELVTGTSEVSGLNRREALELSKKIIIDGTSLHEHYQAKHITEPGLHHVLNEYLRGGDVKRTLTQELLMKEMTYERDPFMRNMLSSLDGAQAVRQGSGAATGGSAGSSTGEGSPPASGTDSKPASASTDKRASPSASLGYARPSRFIYQAWVTLVIVLAIIATILLFR